MVSIVQDPRERRKRGAMVLAPERKVGGRGTTVTMKDPSEVIDLQ